MKGRDREFVLRKAAEFFRSIAHGLTLDPIAATLVTPRHTSPTPGVPDKPGGTDSYTISVVTGQAYIRKGKTPPP